MILSHETMFQNFERQKRKNTLNLFSLLTSETKGSNKFCKGGGSLIASLYKIGYFPRRIFDVFLFKINILLYKFLEHLPYIHKSVKSV